MPARKARRDSRKAGGWPAGEALRLAPDAQQSELAPLRWRWSKGQDSYPSLLGSCPAPPKGYGHDGPAMGPEDGFVQHCQSMGPSGFAAYATSPMGPVGLPCEGPGPMGMAASFVPSANQPCEGFVTDCSGPGYVSMAYAQSTTGFAQSPGMDFAQSPCTGFAPSPGMDFAQSPSMGFAQSPGMGFAPSPSTAAPSPSMGFTQSPCTGFAQSPGMDFAQSPCTGFAQSPGMDFAPSPSMGFAPSPSMGFTQSPGTGFAPSATGFAPSPSACFAPELSPPEVPSSPEPLSAPVWDVPCEPCGSPARPAPQPPTKVAVHVSLEFARQRFDATKALGAVPDARTRRRTRTRRVTFEDQQA